jgi:ketosteroid isomerase-like protein
VAVEQRRPAKAGPYLDGNGGRGFGRLSLAPLPAFKTHFLRAAQECIVDTEGVANRFFAAIEQGVADELEAVYHKNVKIWHNFSRSEQARDVNIALLLKLQSLGNVGYVDIERYVVGDTLAQHHVLQIKNKGELVMEVPAAVFVTVRGGQIVRLVEYIDSASLKRGLID